MTDRRSRRDRVLPRRLAAGQELTQFGSSGERALRPWFGSCVGADLGRELSGGDDGVPASQAKGQGSGEGVAASSGVDGRHLHGGDVEDRGGTVEDKAAINAAGDDGALNVV